MFLERTLRKKQRILDDARNDNLTKASLPFSHD